MSRPIHKAAVTVGSISLSPGPLDPYVFHDYDDTGTSVSYIGYMKDDGTWLMKQMTDNVDINLLYANISNNATYATYTLAWAARVSLNYTELENLTL